MKKTVSDIALVPLLGHGPQVWGSQHWFKVCYPS